MATDLFAAADDILERNAPRPDSLAPEAPGEFAKSLRAGVYGSRSQLHSAVGLAGEALGFDEFGRARAADAAALQARAAENAPRIGSYKQVLASPTLREGLANAGDYVTGLVGSSLPVMAAGVAGGLATSGRGAIPAMLGAAAAQAPFEMGDIVQKQNADPEAMKASAGTRVRDMALGGLASALAQGVVPGVLGAKLMGHGAQAASRRSLKGVIGNNAMAIPVEGAAEGAGEAIKQFGANQNRPFDTDALKESFFGGAAAGGAFGAAGTAVDLARSAAPGATSAIQGAATSINERLAKAKAAQAEPVVAEVAEPKQFTSVVDDLTSMLAKGREAVDDSVDRLRDGTPFGDLKDFATAQGQAVSDRAAVQKMQQVGEQMLQSAGLSPERREQVVAAMQNAGDRARQVSMAGLKSAFDAGQSALAKVKALRESFNRRDVDTNATEITTARIGGGNFTDVTPVKKSNDFSGINKAIADQLVPLLAQRQPELVGNPEAMADLADGARQATTEMTSKRLSADTTFRLIDALGADTAATLDKAFRAVGEQNPAKTETFYKNLNEIAELQARSKTLQDFVGGALVNSSQGLLKSGQLGEFTNLLVSRARGEGINPNAGPQQRAAEDRNFRALMAEHFGDKADAVSLKVEKEAKLSLKGETAKEGEFDEDGNMVQREAMEVIRKGRGPKNEPVMDPALFKSRDMTGQNYADQYIRNMQAKYPDYDVRFEKQEGTDGMGHVVAEKAADAESFSDADLQGMRLDTKKYPHSKDRINVGDMALDTKRIAKAMQRLPRPDGQSSAERLKQTFFEGLARLTAKFGNFDMPDTAVIGQVDGKDFTYGQAKALDVRTAEDRMSDGERAELEELGNQYWENTDPKKREELVEAGRRLRDNLQGRKDGELAYGDDIIGRDFERTPAVTRLLRAMNGADPAFGTTLANNGVSEDVTTQKADKGGQIHEAAARLKPDDLINRSNMDGTPRYTSDKNSANVNYLIDAVAIWARSNSAPAKAIAARTKVLIENFGKMAETDQRRLASLGGDAKIPAASAAEASTIVNALARKYKDVIVAPGEKGESIKVEGASAKLRAADPKTIAQEADKTQARSIPIFEKAIAKRQDYLDNPPQDYSTEVAKGHLDWAGRQKERVDAEYEKAKGGEDLDRQDQLSDMKGALKRLMAKAKSVIEGDESLSDFEGSTPSPKSLAAKKAALLEAASSSDPALLKELATSTDAKALQRAVGVMPDSKALDAANKRLSELVQNPDVAYSMQTKKYSLMGLQVHNSLGRSGFAATHDSPIRHEGKFDWRSHQGKGEGNASFGAGTYLSTAEGVHNSYKGQFTAKASKNHPGVMLGEEWVKGRIAELQKALRQLQNYMGEFKVVAWDRDIGEYKVTDPSDRGSYGENIILVDDLVADVAHELQELRKPVTKSPTYEVSVDIKPEQLLDWDKPLSEQSALVRAASKEAGVRAEILDLGWEKERGSYEAYTEGGQYFTISPRDGWSLSIDGDHYGTYTSLDSAKGAANTWAMKNVSPADLSQATTAKDINGAEIYEQLKQRLGSQAKASEYLQSLGILGHKYAASGGKNDTHPNYVIYDDSKIETNYVHFSAQTTGAGASTAQQRADVAAYLDKVLGASVNRAWANIPHAGDFNATLNLIRISVHALDPLSTAHHEALHAMFDQMKKSGNADITAVLEKAAATPHYLQQMQAIFKNEPAVLAQLADPEERAAYMYQLWAVGKLQVGPQVNTLFGKIAAAIRKVLGIWSNDERALHILDYFNSGKYLAAMNNPSAVRRALMDPGHGAAIAAARKFTDPLMRLANAVASTGSARLRDSGIPALADLADKIKREQTDGSGKDQGFVAASRIEATKRRTALGVALESYTPEQLKEALTGLQAATPAASPEARLAVRAIKAVLRNTRQYMTDAGVDVGDLGPDYFPRVWDTHSISQNLPAFRAMLEPYIRSGEFTGTADQFAHFLSAREGNEFGVETRQPGMQFQKRRNLAFITDADAAPFVTQDLLGTLNSYITQAARRAEWHKRLGDGKLEALLTRAKAEGATKDQLLTAEKYLSGIDGTLGDNIDPQLRRLSGNVIVYQNIRLLPLAAFSSIVDPMGVMVRGGTVGEAWATFRRGVAEIPKNFGRKSANDEATRLAELVGVIDSSVMASTLADVYTQGMVGGTAQKVNNWFFRVNLMEGMNRSFRIGASQAAMSFMSRHADGKASAHSQRWMAELALQAGDVQALPTGGIALTQADGLTPEQVVRVHAAINQWVDGAVLRPDAADKPIWMNDPHWALVAHLKQFVYSFQKTILARVVHEVKHGNYAPAMALASYVPVMMAADFIKGALQGGGDQPEWKKGWGMPEYLAYAGQRAGLLGVGQFGLDAAENVQRGGVGVGALVGPTIEQLADAVQTLGGRKQFAPTLLDALPANALYKEMARNGPGE